MPAEKMDGLSLNPQAELLALLKERAPEVFVEGRVDAAKLAATLGQAVSTDKERYGLSWAGKGECFRHIQEPTTATLRPCRDASVNFDTTENVFIEGDNLNVLKVLQKSYYGRVKMIYIDPPYNTGSDSFIYPDKFSETQDEYLRRIGDKDAEGNLIRDGFWRKNSKDAGHFHSNWLTMMYPRLFLARNLLRQDGVILVSIGDTELHNLTCVMNEIYGEENQIAIFTWKSRAKPTNAGDAKYRPQRVAEYIIAYGRGPGDEIRLNVNSSRQRVYPHEDAEGRYRTTTILTSNRGMFRRETMRFEIAGFTPDVNSRWKAGYEIIKSLHERKRIIFNEDGIPLEKKYEHDEDEPLYPIYTFMDTELTGTAETGKSDLNEIIGNQHGMDTVKPVQLLKYLCATFSNPQDIVLDFFAGSCTTAHAIMELDAEDGGNRKFICVQLPEACDKDSEAAKAGFATIADIGRERIRRAAKKIAEEAKSKLDFDGGKLDLGFKAFRLEESNFKPWRGKFKDAAELEKELTLFVNNVRDGAGSEDILYELILKAGLDVNVPVETKKKGGKTYYRLDGGRLIVCLEEKITQGLVDAMLAEKPQQLITLDRAFAGNDQLKTNTALQLEAEKIEFKVI